MNEIKNERLKQEAKIRYDFLLVKLQDIEATLDDSELTTESKANGTITHPNFKIYESLLKQFNTLTRTIQNLNGESSNKNTKPGEAIAQFAGSKKK